MLLDELYDFNMIRLSDMQERAMNFMHSEGQTFASPDFQFFLKSMGTLPQASALHGPFGQQQHDCSQGLHNVQIGNFLQENVVSPNKSKLMQMIAGLI